MKKGSSSGVNKARRRPWLVWDLVDIAHCLPVLPLLHTE